MEKENKKHPEAQDDEAFWLNVPRAAGLRLCPFETARMGSRAYNPQGEIMDDRLRPVFVKKEEALQRGFIIEDGHMHLRPAVRRASVKLAPAPN